MAYCNVILLSRARGTKNSTSVDLEISAAKGKFCKLPGPRRSAALEPPPPQELLATRAPFARAYLSRAAVEPYQGVLL